MLRVSARRRVSVLNGYRRILVPVVGGPETERAIGVACRLASERGASITALAVLEIPPLLPLDVHLPDEEEATRQLLERVVKTADQFDVRVVTEVLRTRDVGSAIVHRAAEEGVEAIVVGMDRGLRWDSNDAGSAHVLPHVLQRAPCRVLMVAR